uniref:Uncharacterized protein n=1 Tax=Podoviridae sp. ctIyI17 TaxID=2825241 RepID=A0A8S5U4K6_9CAUD|nr:MAG TPA: hypothetical protein [Podoviridae sp. ctIyI17]
MANKKRKLSGKAADTLKEYRRERKNLRARIKYYRDRGFFIPESALPRIPKKITEASVRNIQRASEHLFDKAMYKVRDNIGYAGRIYKPGDTVSGTRGLKIFQKEERQARKAARALELGEYFETLTGEEQAMLFGEGQQGLEGTQQQFDDLIWNRIISVLMEYGTTDPDQIAVKMYDLLLEEEQKVGRETIVARFYAMPEDAVENLQVYLYYYYKVRAIAEDAKADFLQILYGDVQ